MFNNISSRVRVGRSESGMLTATPYIVMVTDILPMKLNSLPVLQYVL